MTKFIKHILIFSILAYILLFIADVFISRGLRKSEDTLMYGINTVMKDSINADILVLGNSRAMCSYNTRIFEDSMHLNVIDLGASGQPFESSYMRYELYKRGNIKPKLIVLNIDFLELREYNHGYNRQHLYPYIDQMQFHPILRKNHSTFFDLYFPMYRYLGEEQLISRGFYESLGVEHFVDGYHGFFNINTPWDGKHLQTLLDNEGMVECFYDSKVVNLLDSFLFEIQHDSIPILMVYAPFYKDVLDNLNDPDSVYDNYNKLSEKYHVPIDNKLYLFYDSDTTYFYNGSHINLIGSEIFTNQLIHDIDSLHLMR